MAVIKVPEDQPTIQLAVNAASSGDVVLVSKGIYKEQVLIPSSLSTLRIIAKNKNVILDGTDLLAPSTAFTSDGANRAEINGFIIQNYSFGIVLQGNVSRRNRIIRNKIVKTDVGISFLGNDNGDHLIFENRIFCCEIGMSATADIADVKFISNVLCKNGTGISVGVGVENTFIENYIVNNKSDGLIVEEGNFDLMLNNTISDNGGKGLNINDSDFVVLLRNRITNNDDNNIILGFANFVAENKIKKNCGKGIIVNSANNTLENNVIEKNKGSGITINTNPIRTMVLRNNLKDNKPFDIEDNSVLQDTNYVQNKCKKSQPPSICDSCKEVSD